MEHHVGAFLNQIGAGVSGVLAVLGVAHLGRFRAFAFAGTSHGFGSGFRPSPHRSSTLSRSETVAVARQTHPNENLR